MSVGPYLPLYLDIRVHFVAYPECLRLLADGKLRLSIATATIAAESSSKSWHEPVELVFHVLIYKFLQAAACENR